jgi:hypothetical protein
MVWPSIRSILLEVSGVFYSKVYAPISQINFYNNWI